MIKVFIIMYMKKKSVQHVPMWLRLHQEKLKNLLETESFYTILALQYINIETFHGNEDLTMQNFNQLTLNIFIF